VAFHSWIICSSFIIPGFLFCLVCRWRWTTGSETSGFATRRT